MTYRLTESESEARKLGPPNSGELLDLWCKNCELAGIESDHCRCPECGSENLEPVCEWA